MSSYVDFGIKTKSQLKKWILRKLGHPLIQVELTEDMINDNIDDSIEYFTKHAEQEYDYLALNLENYVQDTGITLPNNVAHISWIEDDVTASKGINTLWSVPNLLFNSGLGAYPGLNGFNRAGGWVTYELTMEYLKQVKKLTGGGFQFEFNNRTKVMKLRPDPTKDQMKGFVIVLCAIVRPEDQQYGEEWVKKYALAQCKVQLGIVRAKFQGTPLLGGATIDASIKEEGQSEIDKLEEELNTREGGLMPFFYG